MDNQVKSMDCIVLAGGLGTRLRSVVKDVPKPMADINGIPFLRLLLDELHRQGITHFILAIGHKSEVIQDYFSSQELAYKVSFSVEKQPLGTGGALKLALRQTSSKVVLMVNGDTFFRIDIQQFVERSIVLNKTCTIALKRIFNSERYGNVTVEDEVIVKFEEKGFREETLINGGIYLIDVDQFNKLEIGEKFSLETDFFERNVQKRIIGGIEMNGYFIDIGIPEDYERAKQEFIKD